jgi:hypothetical protein
LKQYIPAMQHKQMICVHHDMLVLLHVSVLLVH